MIEQLMSLGLARSEAAFYIAVLSLGAPTVARASKEAGVTRTNGYEITERLIAKGLLSSAPVPQSGQAKRGRPGSTLRANNPETLRSQWQLEGLILDDLIPQLHAVAHKETLTPKVRHFEGAAGIRSALFETLEWEGELRGIFSMQDLFEVPGTREMAEYVEGRRQRNLWLNVVRSRERDYEHVWPSDSRDRRRTRYAPQGKVFTMTTIIGSSSVCVISSRNENFGMIIDSAEYAATQSTMWEYLWQASEE